MDYRVIDKIPQKYKDTVIGFCKKAQSLLPPDNPYFNIIPLIINIILLFYFPSFESKILNDEKEMLFDLLNKNNKSIINYPWKLIFYSREDGSKYDTFIEKVHGRENILLLIEMEGDCVFGGYTKTGWKSDASSEYQTDKDAFVFCLKSQAIASSNNEPFISNVKQDEESISKALGYDWFGKTAYGIFGREWIFYIEECGQVEINYVPNERNNYDPYPEDNRGYLAGYQQQGGQVRAIEVFQMELK